MRPGPPTCHDHLDVFRGGRQETAILLPDGLATPALVVDMDVLDRNISRLTEASQAQGFALCPHAKSHKYAQIADRHFRSGARGLSVATTSEALPAPTDRKSVV